MKLRFCKLFFKGRIFILHNCVQSFILNFVLKVLNKSCTSAMLWFGMFGLIEAGCCANTECLHRIRDCTLQHCAALHNLHLIAVQHVQCTAAHCIALHYIVFICCRLCCIMQHCTVLHNMQVALCGNCIALISAQIGSVSTQESSTNTNTECASCSVCSQHRLCTDLCSQCGCTLIVDNNIQILYVFCSSYSVCIL